MPCFIIFVIVGTTKSTTRSKFFVNFSSFASNATVISWLERHRHLVGGGLLAVSGLTLGAWLSNLLEQKLWAAMPPAPPPLIQAKEQPVYIPPPIENYAAILERNLLRVMVDRPVAADPSTLPVESLAPSEPVVDVSPLPAEVIGTLGGKETVAVALIRDKRNKEVDLYWVGDRLFDQATIIEIARGEVRILRHGKTEVLQIYEQGDPGGGGLNLTPPAIDAAASPAAPPQDPGGIDNNIVRTVGGDEEMPQLSVRPIGENQFIIDKEQFEQAMTNLGPLLTQARVVPNFTKGKINGYKIFAIKSGSVFDQIGIKNGDIIHNVNGVSVDTPEKALQLFQQLRAETDFKIEVERSGAMRPLSYQLR